MDPAGLHQGLEHTGLTRDGKTMVISARGEDSAAKGVNGNQGDNSADEAGAAYIFTIN